MKEKTISEDTQCILNTVAKFIKVYRWQSGYSQRTLAEMASVHYNTISNIESGKHSYNIVSLIEIALALDLPLREVFWEL